MNIISFCAGGKKKGERSSGTAVVNRSQIVDAVFDTLTDKIKDKQSLATSSDDIVIPVPLPESDGSSSACSSEASQSTDSDEKKDFGVIRRWAMTFEQLYQLDVLRNPQNATEFNAQKPDQVPQQAKLNAAFTSNATILKSSSEAVPKSSALPELTPEILLEISTQSKAEPVQESAERPHFTYKKNVKQTPTKAAQASAAPSSSEPSSQRSQRPKFKFKQNSKATAAASSSSQTDDSAASSASATTTTTAVSAAAATTTTTTPASQRPKFKYKQNAAGTPSTTPSSTSTAKESEASSATVSQRPKFKYKQNSSASAGSASASAPASEPSAAKETASTGTASSQRPKFKFKQNTRR